MVGDYRVIKEKSKDSYFISAYVRTKGPSGGISPEWCGLIPTIAASGVCWKSWNPIEGTTGTQATWETESRFYYNCGFKTDIVGGGPNGITQADLCNALVETRPNYSTTEQ